MFVYFVFIVLFIGVDGPSYPLFLLTALVPFQYFTNVVQDGLVIGHRYSSVMTNIPVNPLLFPLTSLVSGLAALLLSFSVFIPFLVFYGITPWPSAVWLPVAVAQTVFVTAGPLYAASIIGVYLPGLRGPIANLLRVSLFVSSGLLSLEMLTGKALAVAQFNPLSSVFNSYRAILLESRPPEVGDVVYSAVSGGVMFAFGLLLFRWRGADLAKEV